MRPLAHRLGSFCWGLEAGVSGKGAKTGLGLRGAVRTIDLSSWMRGAILGAFLGGFRFWGLRESDAVLAWGMGGEEGRWAGPWGDGLGVFSETADVGR